MSSKKVGIGVVVPLVIAMIALMGLFIYAPPTDDIENIYVHLMMNTSGEGPAIGLAWVDPLTDVIFHRIGEEIEVTFFILAPDYKGINFDSVRYIAGDGVEVSDTELVEWNPEGWSSCHYTITMTCMNPENTHLTIRTTDLYGLESSRLFYVIPLG